VAIKSGVGLIDIVNVLFELTQPSLIAERVMVAVNDELPALFDTNEGISNGAMPSDPSARPMAVPPLHEKVSPPPVLALNPIGPTVAPEQIPEILLTKSITGIGLTVVVMPVLVVAHPAAFDTRTVTVWPFDKLLVT
jgi:hypothetical protein